ncbi:MAG: hypothetical protein JST54_06270 [Deltaproteobacteria bacterium]|nr:hypothetical protein [Deltaproteobacteria bacterium]
MVHRLRASTSSATSDPRLRSSRRARTRSATHHPALSSDILSGTLAIARAVAPKDPQLAEVLEAECARLQNPGAGTRARERALLEAAHSRSQFSLIPSGLFDQNVTTFADAEGALQVWAYDDDIVTLDDHEPNPWTDSVDMEKQLTALLASPQRHRVGAIRLPLFEGSARAAAFLAGHRAASLVSHLDVRNQSKTVLVPVASAFPKLRGLSCGKNEVATLLAEGAPELESLVVRSMRGLSAEVLDAAACLPKLRHLGLRSPLPRGEELAVLSAHPVMNQLTSLKLFDVNGADRFPFGALVERHEAFAYLTRLDLPGHLVPEDVRARVRKVLPEAGFVTWARRETMALDFETTGWGAAAR